MRMPAPAQHRTHPAPGQTSHSSQSWRPAAALRNLELVNILLTREQELEKWLVLEATRLQYAKEPQVVVRGAPEKRTGDLPLHSKMA